MNFLGIKSKINQYLGYGRVFIFARADYSVYILFVRYIGDIFTI